MDHGGIDCKLICSSTDILCFNSRCTDFILTAMQTIERAFPLHTVAI